jgi:hypothetical protein
MTLSIKEKLELARACKLEIELVGSPSEPNNFIDFHKELVKIFSYDGFWNAKDSRPIKDCPPHLLTQNIPPHLKWVYEQDEHAKLCVDIYAKIFSAYMSGTALVKRIALTELVMFQPTLDQVTSLSHYEKLVLKAESTIGENGVVSIRALAELLYVAKLPREYEYLVANHELLELDFSTLCQSLRIKSETLKNQANFTKPSPPAQTKSTEKRLVNQVQKPPKVLWTDPATHECVGHDAETCYIALGKICTTCKEAGVKYQHPTHHPKYCQTRNKPSPVAHVSQSSSSSTTPPVNSVNQGIYHSRSCPRFRLLR